MTQQQKNYFGPIGVRDDQRGNDVVHVLLLKCLLSMREQGYV